MRSLQYILALFALFSFVIGLSDSVSHEFFMYQIPINFVTLVVGAMFMWKYMNGLVKYANEHQEEMFLGDKSLLSSLVCYWFAGAMMIFASYIGMDMYITEGFPGRIKGIPTALSIIMLILFVDMYNMDKNPLSF